METFSPADPYSFVPTELRQDNPVIISSPCVRAGTTLLQRLLCSSGKILVYGEYCAVELHFQLNFYLSRVLFFKPSFLQRDRMLTDVLSGEVNNWISDLMPPMESYMEALTRNYLGLFDYYKKYATKEGRTLWGTKVAGWNWQELNLLGGLMQNSRFVYIYRDLEECLASAKSANMVFTEEDTRQFCLNWIHNMESMWHQRQNPRVLLIDFRELVGNSKKEIARLEEFCGTPGIDARVMSHRVNTFKDHDESQGYMQPAVLTDREKEIIVSIAGPLMNTITGKQNPGEKMPAEKKEL